ncbi:MAG: hypothetical protein GEV28_21640 [Actinophytocola sp.]|uniref:Rv3212 family protein n=1 Tax=Actinophytocola sp. TaxID=1872138 RepID=UPI0013284419|nr:hypothetical protein [Actinophytocola sp.]MPZ82857.1 hypothetical protein [Actinophytocola sp.]
MTHDIGDEDALDGGVEPDRYGPVERSRFRRKRDVAFAALIAVAALVVGVLVWQSSDIRETTSQTYSGVATEPALPETFPPSLGEAWRARSPATPVPVTTKTTLVTGDGGDVVGRDPLTGDVRWKYSRDLPLCTVSSAWTMAVAVYAKSSNLLPSDDPRKSGGCSEVTSFDPNTGKRGKPPEPDENRNKPFAGQRDSDAELDTRLLFDGSYVTTTGSRLITTWRSDLVQTMEYGKVPAVVNPDKQPRTGCGYGSVAVVQARIAVVERCPQDATDRLTVYRATGNDDSEKPEVESSVVLGRQGARVVAMSNECRIDAEDDNDVQLCTAVVLPDPARLVVFDEEGERVATHPLSLAPGDLDGDPAGHTVATTRTPGAVYWFTGSRTIALSMTDLSPLWTVENAIGPGTAFAGRMLVPVTDGLAVLAPADGKPVGTIPVDRGGYTGPVTMSTLGPMVYEQRGETLVALR